MRRFKEPPGYDVFDYHTYISVPHWLIATLAGAMAAIVWIRRFSLRTMLLAMTIMATVLGLIVWSAHR